MNRPEDTVNVQRETHLWLAQRLSAMVLAFCIIVHLVTIVGAVQGGLSAAEIIDRVAGSGVWFAFYALFVTAIVVHAPIGLRAILSEMTNLSRARVDLLCFIAATFIAVLGFRVVWGFYTMGGTA